MTDTSNDGATLRRRGLMAQATLGVVAAAAATTRVSVPAEAAVIRDQDVLNFALNLEYLEATYYSLTVTGHDIDPSLTTGVGARGAVTAPASTKITFSSPLAAGIAANIYQDELSHVVFLRTVLGSGAIARPALDFINGFGKLGVAAGLGPLNAFASDPQDVPFLLATFGFEDVGVTAYAGGSTLLQSKAILGAAARILPVEAYHASAGRVRILQAGSTAIAAANAISAARAAASAAVGGGGDDVGVTDQSGVRIAAVGPDGLAFARTPAQVLNIVYVGGASSGYGFFPARANGVVR